MTLIMEKHRPVPQAESKQISSVWKICVAWQALIYSISCDMKTIYAGAEGILPLLKRKLVTYATL